MLTLGASVSAGVSKPKVLRGRWLSSHRPDAQSDRGCRWISRGVAAGHSMHRIARALRRAPSTVSRELPPEPLRRASALTFAEREETACMRISRRAAGSPLQSIDAYDTIETVFLHGRPIPRAELSAGNASQ